METNYFVLEIEKMKDGSIPKNIGEPKAKNEALSQYHQTLASAYINNDLLSIYCAVVDNFGNTIEDSYYENITEV